MNAANFLNPFSTSWNTLAIDAPTPGIAGLLAIIEQHGKRRARRYFDEMTDERLQELGLKRGAIESALR